MPGGRLDPRKLGPAPAPAPGQDPSWASHPIAWRGPRGRAARRCVAEPSQGPCVGYLSIFWGGPGRGPWGTWGVPDGASIWGLLGVLTWKPHGHHQSSGHSQQKLVPALCPRPHGPRLLKAEVSLRALRTKAPTLTQRPGKGELSCGLWLEAPSGPTSNAQI